MPQQAVHEIPPTNMEVLLPVGCAPSFAPLLLALLTRLAHELAPAGTRVFFPQSAREA